MHPLDRVGIDVGRRHLDGRRQVDDGLAVGTGLPHVVDRVADLDGEVELSSRVGLRGVLEVDVGVAHRVGELLAQLGALHRDVDDALAGQSEHDPSLQRRGRVVEVDDRLLRPLDRLEGPLDLGVAGLGQHLDHDVVGHQVLFDQDADEVEVGLRGGREADLDLLVSHPHQQLEHAALAGGAHRVDEGLVAVAQVDGAPLRRARDGGRRPGAVGQVDRSEGAVARDGHRGGLLFVVHGHHLSAAGGCGQRRLTPRRGDRPRSGPRRGYEGAGRCARVDCTPGGRPMSDVRGESSVSRTAAGSGNSGDCAIRVTRAPRLDSLDPRGHHPGRPGFAGAAAGLSGRHGRGVRRRRPRPAGQPVRRAGRPPRTPQTFVRELRWVLHDAGMAVGVARASFFLRDNTDQCAVMVAVHPDHRRRGYGRGLVRLPRRDGDARGAPRLITEIAEPLVDGRLRTPGPAFATRSGRPGLWTRSVACWISTSSTRHGWTRWRRRPARAAPATRRCPGSGQYRMTSSTTTHC